ncbi:MAG: hypothetical protein R3324_08200 [Halobacteriales archaeon]|nr:hypothetical protein [Halobacteriales archaeon]
MAPRSSTLSNLGTAVLRIAVMVVVAIVTFYLSVFVVGTGARLAGYQPEGNFVVLAAALLVVATILAGGFSPRVTITTPLEEPAVVRDDDPTYD